MSDLTHTFIIADDHPLFRTAMVQTLTRQYPKAALVEAEDLHSLQQVIPRYKEADLVLLDLHMPGACGFSGLIFITNHFPSLPVLMVSASDDVDIIQRAIEHGAAGFLSKTASMEEIAEAIAAVLDGEIFLPKGITVSQTPLSQQERDLASIVASLTPSQFRVASMLAEGLPNKLIAYELHVTEATVKAHITEVFRKLGVSSRTQAGLLFSKLNVETQHKEG